MQPTTDHPNNPSFGTGFASCWVQSFVPVTWGTEDIDPEYPWDCTCGESYASSTGAVFCRKCIKYLENYEQTATNALTGECWKRFVHPSAIKKAEEASKHLQVPGLLTHNPFAALKR